MCWNGQSETTVNSKITTNTNKSHPSIFSYISFPPCPPGNWGWDNHCPHLHNLVPPQFPDWVSLHRWEGFQMNDLSPRMGVGLWAMNMVAVFQHSGKNGYCGHKLRKCGFRQSFVVEQDQAGQVSFWSGIRQRILPL